MPSIRQERVAKRIIQEVVEYLKTIDDNNLGFITITRAEISPDLRQATVYFSVLGNEEEIKRSTSILKRYAGKMRGFVGRRLAIKVMPELHFTFDRAVSQADKMSQLISEARKTDSNPNPYDEEEQKKFLDMFTKKESKKRKDWEKALSEPIEDMDFSEHEDPFAIEDWDDDPNWKPINLDEVKAKDK